MVNLKGKSINDAISFSALFVAFVCATNGELLYTDSVVLYYLPFACCFFALAFELLTVGIKSFSSYLTWRIVLILLFVFAMLYAADYDNAFVVIKKYLLQTGVVLLIGFKCAQKRENLRTIIKICILSIVLALVYLYSMVDFSLIFEGYRLGVTMVNESWNANNIGLMVAYGMGFAIFIWFLSSRSKSIPIKLIGLSVIGLFAVTAALSGSKKSIIIILAVLVLYLLRSSKSHKVRNLLIAVILLMVAAYAMYNVPFLYNSIGYRFETLLESLFSEGGDRSSKLRQEMISVGIDAFFQKPFFGHGLGSFSKIYGVVSGWEVYAHNNYIELLVGTGLLGGVLYYGYIFKIMLKKCVANKQTAFFKAMLIAMLIGDVGCVSFYDPSSQYILCLLIYGVLYASDMPMEQHNENYTLKRKFHAS